LLKHALQPANTFLKHFAFFRFESHLVRDAFFFRKLTGSRINLCVLERSGLQFCTKVIGRANNAGLYLWGSASGTSGSG
jgi:hypothetical protein